jgi:hypothetical protein
LMNFPVHFYYQLRFRAIKIHNESANAMLTPEA